MTRRPGVVKMVGIGGQSHVCGCETVLHADAAQAVELVVSAALALMKRKRVEKEKQKGLARVRGASVEQIKRKLTLISGTKGS